MARVIAAGQAVGRDVLQASTNAIKSGTERYSLTDRGTYRGTIRQINIAPSPCRALKLLVPQLWDLKG